MIYCVEDDASIRELMLYTLRASGYEAEGFEQGSELLDALKRYTPKLIMLDIMLPGMDGIEILKHLRSNPATARIPVIMATAKGTEYDRVLGLDAGADDYLSKPFGMLEMVSRIRAVLRRPEPAEQTQILSMGSLQLDTAADTVLVLVMTHSGPAARRTVPDEVFLPAECYHWGRKRYAVKLIEILQKKA